MIIYFYGNERDILTMKTGQTQGKRLLREAETPPTGWQVGAQGRCRGRTGVIRLCDAPSLHHEPPEVPLQPPPADGRTAPGCNLAWPGALCRGGPSVRGRAHRRRVHSEARGACGCGRVRGRGLDGRDPYSRRSVRKKGTAWHSAGQTPALPRGTPGPGRRGARHLALNPGPAFRGATEPRSSAKQEQWGRHNGLASFVPQALCPWRSTPGMVSDEGVGFAGVADVLSSSYCCERPLSSHYEMTHFP